MIIQLICSDSCEVNTVLHYEKTDMYNLKSCCMISDVHRATILHFH